MTANHPATNPPALSIADLDITADEPRILDLRIAERLGFKRPRVIREMIERNRDELETYGSLAPRRAAQVRKNGASVQVDEYHLNEAQALLICMFSKTPEAAPVRREVITVFMAWRRNDLSAPPHLEEVKDGRYLVIVRKGQVCEMADIANHSVVDGADPTSLWTFLREFVPVENLHVAMDIIGARSVHLMKHGPQGRQPAFLQPNPSPARSMTPVVADRAPPTSLPDGQGAIWINGAAVAIDTHDTGVLAGERYLVAAPGRQGEAPTIEVITAAAYQPAVADRVFGARTVMRDDGPTAWGGRAFRPCILLARVMYEWGSAP